MTGHWQQVYNYRICNQYDYGTKCIARRQIVLTLSRRTKAYEEIHFMLYDYSCAGCCSAPDQRSEPCQHPEGGGACHRGHQLRSPPHIVNRNWKLHVSKVVVVSDSTVEQRVWVRKAANRGWLHTLHITHC